MKPKRVITSIHTGTGDEGLTDVWERRLEKNTPAVQYIGCLDDVQSSIFVEDSFDSNIKNCLFFLQDVFFTMGASAYNPLNTEYAIELQRLYKIAENIMEILFNKYSELLKPLSGFILTNNENRNLMNLRIKIRQAERQCLTTKNYAFDWRYYNIFSLHIKFLNLLSDLVFLLVWIITGKSSPEKIKTWDGIKSNKQDYFSEFNNNKQ